LQASSFAEFVVWRILSGFGVGGSIPVLFSFVGEFTPVFARGKMIVAVRYCPPPTSMTTTTTAAANTCCETTAAAPVFCARPPFTLDTFNHQPQRRKSSPKNKIHPHIIPCLALSDACSRAGGRGGYLQVAFFWVIGTVICASLAWIILGANECPTQADWIDQTNSTLGEGDASLGPYCKSIEGTGCDKYGTRAGWRVFMGACSAPAITTAFFLFFAHESPKFLVGANKPERAVRVLKRMAEINRVDVTIDQPPPSRRTRASKEGGIMAYWEIVMRTLRPPNKTQFLWLCGVWFFLCFGFYGFRCVHSGIVMCCMCVMLVVTAHGTLFTSPAHKATLPPRRTYSPHLVIHFLPFSSI
jgi:MFS family permease